MEIRKKTLREIKKWLKDTLVTDFKVSPQEISDATFIVDGLGFDSIDIAELAFKIEKEYLLEKASCDVVKEKTFGQVAQFISQNQYSNA